VATIRRLPPDLANQIAAGEVVERPSSVVKELVENSIDAGARRVSIHVEFGGKKQVRVEDDGEGMAPDDARLALERHATSKIGRVEDLAAILTLGFRGEALPAIASASHFVLRTRARGQESGTEIRVNGGTVASMTEIGAAEGTVVEVNDIFYNLPARRKFLRADGAESAQISRVVTQLALANPRVGFTLTSATRTVLQLSPVQSLRERMFQLYGERPDLVELHKEAGGLRVFGYVAALAEQGPVRGAQNVFINSRIVKDRTIAHAIIDAYSVASMKERSPEVHLFIEMPPDMVDVNVHPTKAEVRFRDQSAIHEIVRRAVLEALGRPEVPELQLRSERVASVPASPALPGIVSSGAYPTRWARPSEAVPADPRASGQAVAPPPAVASTAADMKPMIPLGQFRDTFIIAVDDEGVAIIDQHVAHERVLFERVMGRLADARLESQRLLVPMLIDVLPAAQQTLQSRAAELERFGFDIEPFGSGAVKVTAMPALLSAEECANTLLAIAEDLESLDPGAQVQDALRRIAATTACHAAVKANCPLTYDKMTHLLGELRATAYSTVCPHGRPVMLRLTRREIEKNFERI
jgi:DNA mismatch repair protein MutL